MGQSKHPETKLKLSDGYGAIKIDEIKKAVEGIKKDTSAGPDKSHLSDIKDLSNYDLVVIFNK